MASVLHPDVASGSVSAPESGKEAVDLGRLRPGDIDCVAADTVAHHGDPQVVPRRYFAEMICKVKPLLQTVQCQDVGGTHFPTGGRDNLPDPSHLVEGILRLQNHDCSVVQPVSIPDRIVTVRL